MSSDKHTQGQIDIDTDKNYVSKYRIYETTTGANVGWFDPDEETIEQGEANAERIVKAWNNYDQLLEALDGIGSLLEFAIHATPTGAVRNLLTDANVIAKAAIEKTKP